MSRTDARDDAVDRAHARRRPPRYRSLVLHWAARALRRPGRAKVGPLPPVAPGQVAVSFAGHATVLLRYANLAIVCDPLLGGWCGPVRREVRPGLSPAELGDVDLVLLSHRDPDHLCRRTLAKLPRAATVILPQRSAHRVSDLGFARVVELGVGQSVEHRRVDISTVAVRYGGPRDPALGYVIRGDGPSLFFCGDSGYFSGFAEIGRRFRPDIALLPIGGYAPRSFRTRHMSPPEALTALSDLRARVLIPIRHGSFALSVEHLHDPERWLAELVALRHLDPYVASLVPGESRVFSRPGIEHLGDPAEPQSEIGFSDADIDAPADADRGADDPGDDPADSGELDDPESTPALAGAAEGK